MNWKTYFFWITNILIIALSIYTFFWIHSNSYQCLNNPYVYSINLLEKSNHGEVTAIFTSSSGARAFLSKDGFKSVEIVNDGLNNQPYFNTSILNELAEK